MTVASIVADALPPPWGAVEKAGLAPVVFSGQLYVFYAGPGGAVYVATPPGANVTDGAGWSATELDGISSADAPAPLVYDGQLYLFYVGSGSRICVAWPASDGGISGQHWTTGSLNAMLTGASPGAVVL